MKPLSIALLLFVVSLPVGGAQPRIADRMLAGLAGPVKTVTTDVAPLAPGCKAPANGARERESVERYDRRGDLVASSAYANGEVVERETFRYASDGTRLGQATVRSAATVFAVVSTSADRSHSTPEWRTSATTAKMTYDGHGYRLSSVVSGSLASETAELSRETFVYDDEGRVVESRRLAADGSTIDTTGFVYDVGGRPASTEVRRADGSRVRRVEYCAYTIDARGNWTYRTEKETDSRGNVRSRKARWREVEYYEAPAQPRNHGPKNRSGADADDIALATRPRRVHPLAESASDIPTATRADEVRAFTFEVADDASAVHYVSVYSPESPYGMTRPRRVFPLHEATPVAASSIEEALPSPEPSPEPSRERVPARTSFTDVMTH